MELPEVIHQLCNKITVLTIHMLLSILCHLCVSKRRTPVSVRIISQLTSKLFHCKWKVKSIFFWLWLQVTKIKFICYMLTQEYIWNILFYASILHNKKSFLPKSWCNDFVSVKCTKLLGLMIAMERAVITSLWKTSGSSSFPSRLQLFRHCTALLSKDWSWGEQREG